jgi:hypothetical protein
LEIKESNLYKNWWRISKRLKLHLSNSTKYNPQNETASKGRANIIIKKIPYIQVSAGNINVKKFRLNEKAKIDKNYLNQILISLMEKGLIFRIGRGRYKFTLPLFEKFLLRKG